MGCFNSTESCPQINPSSVDVWFLDGFDPRDPKQPGGAWPAWMWKYHAAIRYLVGRVAVGQATELRKKKQSDGWVALRREDVWSLFGNHDTYNEVRNELLRRKILECDEKFTRGEKSKWYKLGDDWCFKGISLVKVTDRRLIRKIVKFKEIRSNRPYWPPCVYHLDYWLKQFRIDESMIQRYLAQKDRSPKQWLTAIQVILIQSGLADLMVDCYGRNHHVGTNLRRVIRSALNALGFRLAEIDICNAQPLLTGYIVAMIVSGQWPLGQVINLGQELPNGSMFHGYIRLAKGTEKEGEEEDTKAGREGTKTVPNLNLLYTLPNLTMSPILPGLPFDLLDFIRVCERGVFYQTLAELWGLDYEKYKSKIKKIVFRRMLFGRIRKFSSHWKAIRERWPTLAAILESIKEEDYGVLARVCQRLESSLMINVVADQFRVGFPEIPVMTIHDSLLVPPDAIGIAQSTILDAFGAVGLKPALKTK